METFCVSCKKYAANKNSIIRKTKQNRLMLLSKCAVRGKKKNQLLLKIKHLLIFQIISLKSLKSLTNIY